MTGLFYPPVADEERPRSLEPFFNYLGQAAYGPRIKYYFRRQAKLNFSLPKRLIGFSLVTEIQPGFIGHIQDDNKKKLGQIFHNFWGYRL